MGPQTWVQKRAEKGETLHMVHVQMAEQDVDSFVVPYVVTELAYATPCVEHDKVAVGGE